MLSRLFDSGSLPALELMLKFAGARQKTIAANVANCDTAGYVTLDIPDHEFRGALTRAFQGQTEPVEFRPRASADAGVLKPGGNNVDLELEMAKMARNTALHGAAAALLAQQFNLLREAVAGHVIS